MRLLSYRRIIQYVGMGLLLAGIGCGGATGIPLVAGSVMGSYKGMPFSGLNGFAKDRTGSSVIGLGAGPLNCDTPEQADPPSGLNAVISTMKLDVGSYSSVSISILRNDGDYESHGQNSGMVQITKSDSTSVAGTVAFTLTDKGETYSINGMFEVARCK